MRLLTCYYGLIYGLLWLECVPLKSSYTGSLVSIWVDWLSRGQLVTKFSCLGSLVLPVSQVTLSTLAPIVIMRSPFKSEQILGPHSCRHKALLLSFQNTQPHVSYYKGTNVKILFRYHQLSSNILSLAQDLNQNPTLQVVVEPLPSLPSGTAFPSFSVLISFKVLASSPCRIS